MKRMTNAMSAHANSINTDDCSGGSDLTTGVASAGADGQSVMKVMNNQLGLLKNRLSFLSSRGWRRTSKTIRLWDVRFLLLV